MSGTFNVRNPEIETKLRELARVIDESIEGSGFGFALFLVEFEKPDGGLFYISDAQRRNIVPAIAEWCKRQSQ